MTEERKRASALDLSGFEPRPADSPAPDPSALASVIDETPFKSRVVEKATPAPAPAADAVAETPKRGRPSRGSKSTVYARVPDEHYARLQRIREDKGWSLVTALERAIDALGRQEGID